MSEISQYDFNQLQSTKLILEDLIYDVHFLEYDSMEFPLFYSNITKSFTELYRISRDTNIKITVRENLQDAYQELHSYLKKINEVDIIFDYYTSLLEYFNSLPNSYSVSCFSLDQHKNSADDLFAYLQKTF
jgi:hypothetical protein